jgi:regulatory protein
MDNGPDLSKGKKLALKYLTRQARSRKETLDYLIRKGFDKTVSENILEYLENLNYIDDQKLAAHYADYRKNFKKEGKIRIEQELFRKGISIEVISGVIEHLFKENEELILAKSFAKKFLLKMESQDPEKLKKKLIYKLKRKGYCDNTVLAVIKEYI